MQTSFACGRYATKTTAKGADMAIYHMSVKTFSRSKGQSATAAAAYRASEKIVDNTTGQIHDYTRKGGLEFAQVVTPNKEMPTWANQQNREQIWNEAEKAETRKNSTVAREFVIALPSELDPIERLQLTTEFAQELVNRHGFIADVAIHQPNRAGDERNHHAHILCTTRRIGVDGFTEKTRELDDFKSGEVVYWRERWQDLANEYLTNALTPTDARVTCKSFREQGITDQIPQIHYGVNVIGYERRTGQTSDLRQRRNAQTDECPRLSQLLDRLCDAEYDCEQDLQEAKKEKEYIEAPEIKRFEMYVFRGLQNYKTGQFKDVAFNAIAELKSEKRIHNIEYIKTTDERFPNEPVYVYQKEIGVHTTPMCWTPSMGLYDQPTRYERTPNEVHKDAEKTNGLSIAERVLMLGKDNRSGYNVASEYKSVCREAKDMNPVRVESRAFGDDPPNSPTMIYQFEDGSILKAKVYEPCAVLDVGIESDPTSSRDFEM